MVKKGKLTLGGKICLVLVSVAVSLMTICPAATPKELTEFIVCALPSGSIGYTLMLGIGKAVKKNTGAPVRLIPGGPDIARLMPTVRGKSQFSLLVGYR